MTATLRMQAASTLAKESGFNVVPTLPEECSRVAAYFGDPGANLFGWYRAAPGLPPLDCVAVICNPIGPEYGSSHRAVRHLADSLASKGVPALRFDYHGVGDSMGSDLDGGRLDAWKSSIHSAIAFARSQSGRQRVCLIGIRLGATLAAMCAAEAGIGQVVLWNPCVTGRHFLRQQRAMGLATDQKANSPNVAMECAGYAYTADTIAAIESIDLREQTFSEGLNLLVVERDDKLLEPSVSDCLVAAGITHERAKLPGYAAMTREPQFTEVPQEAIDFIADWVARHGTTFSGAVAPSPVHALKSIILAGCGAGSVQVFEEIPCRFGASERLFGILARPVAESRLPVVVMFNAGSNHHIGGFRLYVDLARKLASQGSPNFRVDIGGIGDSVLAPGERENHPYPLHAQSDAEQAFAFLENRFGYRNIIPLGHCSGAHAAFHAGLNITAHKLVELIQINPLAFYWVEGMGLETAGQD
jgi:alpha/beta superfamily hydrolase